METTNFKKSEIENWQNLPLVDIESPSSDFYSKHDEIVQKYHKKGMEAKRFKNFDNFLGEHHDF
ncbi:hypothetical protein [Aquiflexum lacus]|uniref:hypothetical protein n=1 Tax=Aquiflexum lacus TaxID=2483805 RepID=UPI0018958FDC|nr:hypothetical protein [Aquiflexum lacus]